jgi:hypothetical protein
MIQAMNPEIEELFDTQGGVATTGQILTRITRRPFEAAVNCGVLERMWQGVYCRGEPTTPPYGAPASTICRRCLRRRRR